MGKEAKTNAMRILERAKVATPRMNIPTKRVWPWTA